jgi:hypothetical protein
MADYQIGDNLYADNLGKYYNLLNGVKTYTASPYDTTTQNINQTYDSQKKSQLDALKVQRDKAISGFNQQKVDLAPQYQNQRNQADVVNTQNVSRLRELMAANGINASGENLTTQANLASSRQNSFNDINNNENQAYHAIDQQIAQANDPSQEQAITNSVEADRSKALADAFNQNQQDIYQKYTDWRNYQDQLKQEEQQRQQWEYQKQMDAQKAAMDKAQFDIEQQMRQLQLQKALAAQTAAATAKASSAKSSSSKKTTSKSTTASKQTSLAQAYAQYKQQQAVQQKYAPTPFKATQTKPRQII